MRRRSPKENSKHTASAGVRDSPAATTGGHIPSLDAAKRRKWREKDRAAITAYNDHVEKHGVFSDGVRSF